MPVKKIPVSELEIGMFVSSLDRPWSETPFMLQGLLVKTDEELKQLRACSKFVFIMQPDDEIEIQTDNDSYSLDPSSYSLHKPHYEVVTATEQELKSVSAAHEKLAELVTNMEKLVKDHPERVALRIAHSIEEMVWSVERNPDAYLWLTRTTKYRSYLYRDALTSSVLGAILGTQLGMPESELKLLATGLLLMDIGKTTLSIELLNKRERLSHEEWEQMKSHVKRSVEMLYRCKALPQQVLDIAWTHHERLDGSGYPSGIKGSKIPLFGQIAGIIDFYVAVTTPRPFAKAISPAKAIAMLYEQQGRYFDEALVEEFIQILGTYPTGSLVELSSGEVGMIASQNHDQRLKPDILLLLDKDKQPYPIKRKVSLAKYTHDADGKPISIYKARSEGSHSLKLHKLND